MDDMCEIIDEIKVETKFFSIITLKVVVATAMGVFAGLVFSNFTANQVKLFVIILCGLLGFFLSLPSSLNRGKRYIHTVIFYLKRLKERDIAYGMPDIENEISDSEPVMSSEDVYFNFDFIRKELE